MNPILTKSYRAGAVVAGRRFVKFDADGKVIQAAAAGDDIIGVSDAMGSASGGMLDVHELGIADVQAGGAFAAGDPLTANADGEAVKAAPAAGATARVGGQARAEALADGDIVPALVIHASITMPA